MSTFHRLRLAFARRQDLLNSQGVSLLHNVTPVFEAKRRWTNRWTFTLVFAQLAVTVVGADLILKHWTERVEPSEDSSKPDASVDTRGEPEYRLRPLHQRLPLATAQYAIGAFICYLIISMRSRIVRRLYVLPSSAVTRSAPFAPKLRGPPHDRALVVQNVWHWRGQGRVFPFSAAHLEAGKDESEVMLRIDEQPGAYLLTLPRAKVNGEEEPSLWNFKKKLYAAWYGEKKGTQELAKQGWEKQREA